MILDEFEWQNGQGTCPTCGYEFFLDILDDKKKDDFKYCIGFIEPAIGHYGQPYMPKKGLIEGYDFVIGFECPECFIKSVFHVNQNWEEKYGKWIKNA